MTAELVPTHTRLQRGLGPTTTTNISELLTAAGLNLAAAFPSSPEVVRVLSGYLHARTRGGDIDIVEPLLGEIERLPKWRTPATPTPGDRLEGRELQVLFGMAHGLGNRAIGDELYLTEDTIKHYARKVFAKLGARDRAHAVFLAGRLGYLDEPQ